MNLFQKSGEITRMQMNAEQKKEATGFLGYIFAVTFIIGMCAHAYIYFQGAFSHDSLGAIYAGVYEEHWKIALGRWVVPVYRTVIRSKLALPWVIGLLTHVWIGCAVFLIVNMLHLCEKRVAAVVTGVFVSCLTVTAMGATFLYELDVDMFAMLLMTVAVCLWRTQRFGWIVSSVLILGGLGIYQCYLSVAVVLIMLICIMDLGKGEAAAEVFLNGLKGVAMILLGGVLYVVSLKVSTVITGVELVENYNGLAGILERQPQELPGLFMGTYKSFFTYFLGNHVEVLGTSLTKLNKILFVVAFVLTGLLFLRGDIHPLCKGLIALLVLLLPVGMNFTYILTGGMVHDLMRYAYNFFYIYVILLVEWTASRVKCRPIKPVVLILLAVMIWNNVQVANAVYLKKDLEQKATLSLMTRVVDRLETTSGYEAGVSPVVFVGIYQSGVVMAGFEEMSEISGAQTTEVITYNTIGMYEAYFDYILNTPVNLAYDVWSAMQTDVRIETMPAFPDAKSIAVLDGVFVVNMGA